jgi:hypothetical protein
VNRWLCRKDSHSDHLAISRAGDGLAGGGLEGVPLVGPGAEAVGQATAVTHEALVGLEDLVLGAKALGEVLRVEVPLLGGGGDGEGEHQRSQSDCMLEKSEFHDFS